MLAASPAQETQAQLLVAERVLRAELYEHPLVQSVSETRQWGVANASDNDRKIFAVLKHTDACRGQTILQSCASVKQERLTKAKALAELLSKVDARMAHVGSVAALQHTAQQGVEASGASVAASASDTAQPERGPNLFSHIMMVAALRERIARANNSVRALCNKINEIECKFQNELLPLQDMRAKVEAELKSLADELEEMTKQSRPGKQQRLDQQAQPSDDAGMGSTSVTQQLPFVNWLRREWLRQETMKLSASQEPLSESVAMPPAEKRRRGEEGPLDHWRWGLVGLVKYWAEGSSDYAVHLLLELSLRLGLTDRMRARLCDTEKEHSAKTDTYIVDRFVEALTVLKQCESEEQRRQYLIALALVMQPPAEVGDSGGWERRVTERLRVRRGCRSAAEGQRPFASKIAQRLRATFDASSEQLDQQLREGDVVQTRHGRALLKQLLCDGGCILTFQFGDASVEKTYPVCFGNGKGSARLRRPPLLLMPQPRSIRSDAVSESLRRLILAFVAQVCPTSPHQRDVMRKLTAPFLVEERAESCRSPVD